MSIWPDVLHRCKNGEWVDGRTKDCKVCNPPKKHWFGIKVKW